MSRLLLGWIGIGEERPEVVTRRPREIEAETATLTRRLAELEREIVSMKDFTVDLNHVSATLAEFDAVWDVLLPVERTRLVHLLVERVVSMPDSQIQVVFRTTGLR